MLFSSRHKVKIRCIIWLVSGYAHVFILLSVVIVTHPQNFRLCDDFNYIYIVPRSALCRQNNCGDVTTSTGHYFMDHMGHESSNGDHTSTMNQGF